MTSPGVPGSARQRRKAQRRTLPFSALRCPALPCTSLSGWGKLIPSSDHLSSPGLDHRKEWRFSFSPATTALLESFHEWDCAADFVKTGAPSPTERARDQRHALATGEIVRPLGRGRCARQRLVSSTSAISIVNKPACLPPPRGPHKWSVLTFCINSTRA